MMERGAILIMGPPGGGKGTQADLVANELNFFHFDTGRYINELLKRDRTIPKKIKEEVKKGNLAEFGWTLKTIKKEIKRIAQAGYGVVLSGSPRSFFEAFGDKKHEGLISFLVKLYGRKNIFIFRLAIPPQTSLSRNSRRMVCSVCKKSHILRANLTSCPFCGGKLVRRIDDKPEIIKFRLEEYNLRTKPIFGELKKQGFKVILIDGTPKPEIIFKSIRRKIV